MKTRIFLSALSLILLPSLAVLGQQDVKARSTEIDVDYTTVKLVQPIITWISPDMDESNSTINKVGIKLIIESASPIKSITIIIKEDEGASHRGSSTIVPKENEKFKLTIDKQLTLLDGKNIIEVVAENESGGKLTSQRKVITGVVAVAAATTNDRKDYALLFATDTYDHWNPLINPVFDSKAIGKELQQYYGYQVEIIENPTQEDILVKLREYAGKKYKQQDQLLIFFAGHGYFDDTFKEGFVVCKNSLLNDPARTTYLSHNRLRSIVNSVPCEHILLTMDVCFGGTFDPVLASSRGQDDLYEDVTRAEFITRKLQYKTRRYITSGGKEYVSDGAQGKHSPFARKVLEALRTYGGRDGIVTTDELRVSLSALKNEPRYGEFGDNEPGSDFVFVTVKDK